jgi:hypothetical protein
MGKIVTERILAEPPMSDRGPSESAGGGAQLIGEAAGLFPGAEVAAYLWLCPMDDVGESAGGPASGGSGDLCGNTTQPVGTEIVSATAVVNHSLTSPMLSQ